MAVSPIRTSRGERRQCRLAAPPCAPLSPRRPSSRATLRSSPDLAAPLIRAVPQSRSLRRPPSSPTVREIGGPRWRPYRPPLAPTTTPSPAQRQVEGASRSGGSLNSDRVRHFQAATRPARSGTTSPASSARSAPSSPASTHGRWSGRSRAAYRAGKKERTLPMTERGRAGAELGYTKLATLDPARKRV